MVVDPLDLDTFAKVLFEVMFPSRSREGGPHFGDCTLSPEAPRCLPAAFSVAAVNRWDSPDLLTGGVRQL